MGEGWESYPVVLPFGAIVVVVGLLVKMKFDRPKTENPSVVGAMTRTIDAMAKTIERIDRRGEDILRANGEADKQLALVAQQVEELRRLVKEMLRDGK